MAPHDSFDWSHPEKEQEEGRSGGNGGKTERKLSEVISQGQNEMIGEFKMMASDVINLRG